MEEKLGRPVPPSTVYLMLHLHGWRKIAPDKRHIKRDPETQGDKKKNASPKS
ncbi:MAG: helix-turn-helix domain-containing protein [Sulfobacillus sp.]